MATLTLIGEPFPDWEAPIHSAAARDLAAAVAATAPRSCSARFLLAKGSDEPEFTSPVLRTERLPMRAGMLPIVWQSGATARPLDGEFVHALTPMVPLRARGDDDGSQTSVMIPHSIAWEAAPLLGNAQARLFRAFTRRAVRLADVVLAPTHATARVLQHHYGEDLPVQVMPLAPPAEFTKPAQAAERRAALGLPERYVVTTATPGPHGRLEWVFDALRADPSLPSVVVVDGLDPVAPAREQRDPKSDAAESPIPADLQHRVHLFQPQELADVGTVLSGASLLLQPQSFSGTGYLVLGALSASVPVLHAGHEATTEVALDGGITAESAEAFAAEFGRLMRDDAALSRLAVLALDRSKGFGWHPVAWQLWETHANM
ncbi:mannosyltransferase [Leucobacter zeae]|nr:mannosyltransferase [Leucobacter zeae]